MTELESAQLRKIDRLLDQAGVTEGSRVLAKPVTMAKLVECVARMLDSLCSPAKAS